MTDRDEITENQKLHILDGGSPDRCFDHGLDDGLDRGLDHATCSKNPELFTATAVHDLRGHLQLIASGISLLHHRYEKVFDVKGDEILIAMSKDRKINSLSASS